MDPYKALKVKKDATNEEIKIAYKEALKKFDSEFYTSKRGEKIKKAEVLKLTAAYNLINTDAMEDKFDNLRSETKYRILPKKDFYKRAKEMIKREYNSLDSKVQDLIYLSDLEEDEYNLVGNAIKNYADLDEDEEVFFCYDNTVFKSAKDGIILTNKSIHCQNKRENPWKIDLDDIKEIHYKKDKFWSPKIYINNKRIDCTALDKESERFKEFLEKCINYIKDIKEN